MNKISQKTFEKYDKMAYMKEEDGEKMKQKKTTEKWQDEIKEDIKNGNI